MKTEKCLSLEKMVEIFCLNRNHGLDGLGAIHDALPEPMSVEELCKAIAKWNPGVAVCIDIDCSCSRPEHKYDVYCARLYDGSRYDPRSLCHHCYYQRPGCPVDSNQHRGSINDHAIVVIDDDCCYDLCRYYVSCRLHYGPH